MKFGKSYEEAKNEVVTTDGDFFKWFKDGDTTFRIIQEPKEWEQYWEHFNPGGFPFPCTNDRKTCPGCTSSNEKMKKASRKVAIQVLEGEFVNVYKFPRTLADKLDNRYERIGTLLDRDYTITRFSSKNSDGSTKVDYDIEGGDKTPVDLSKVEFKDVESMLQRAYDEAWGDSDRAKQTKVKAEQQSREETVGSRIKQMAAEGKGDDTPRPFEQKQDPQDIDYNEDDLRSMKPEQLWKIAESGGLTLPGEAARNAMSSDGIVDWMISELEAVG